MRPAELRWDWRDILSAGRRALSLRKMALHARGVVLAYLCTVVFFYVGCMASGMPFWLVWRDFGLSVVLMVGAPPPFALPRVALSAAGIVSLLVLLHYGTAVSRLCYQQLRGDYFYSARSALRYAGRRSRDAIGALTGLMGVVVLIRLAAWAGGAVGRIPVVGEWLTAVGSLFVVAGFVAGLVVSVGLATLLVGVVAAPSVAGVVGVGGVETTYQLVLMVWNQPWRLAVYETALAVLQFVGGAVFYAMGAWGFFTVLDSVAAGYPPLEDAFQTAAHLVWGKSLPLGFGMGWRFQRVTGLSAAMSAATVVSTVSFLLVTCVWASYVLSIGSVGNTLLYINLRRRIRGDNVLEVVAEARSDEEDGGPSEPPSGPTESPDARPAEASGVER
jgi:hypothetical protein